MCKERNKYLNEQQKRVGSLSKFYVLEITRAISSDLTKAIDFLFYKDPTGWRYNFADEAVGAIFTGINTASSG